MKKMKNTAESKKAKPTASKNKKKSIVRLRKQKQKSKSTNNEMIPANQVAGHGIEKGRRKTKTKIPEPARGRCKVPEAGDKHGCNHHGVLELLPLPKACLEAFM
jgi:hypothetical protein